MINLTRLSDLGITHLSLTGVESTGRSEQWINTLFRYYIVCQCFIQGMLSPHSFWNNGDVAREVPATYGARPLRARQRRQLHATRSRYS